MIAKLSIAWAFFATCFKLLAPASAVPLWLTWWVVFAPFLLVLALAAGMFALVFLFAFFRR